MADKQGLLGARSAESDDGGQGRGDREAYEEDWYRSLRALAERQQQATGREDEQPAEEPEPLADRVEESEVPREELDAETTPGEAGSEVDGAETGASSIPDAPERPETWPTERREPHLQLVTDPPPDGSPEREYDDDRASTPDAGLAAETSIDVETAPPVDASDPWAATDEPEGVGADGPSVFAGIAEPAEDLEPRHEALEADADQDAPLEAAPDALPGDLDSTGDLQATSGFDATEPAADVGAPSSAPVEQLGGIDQVEPWPSDLPEPVSPEQAAASAASDEEATAEVFGMADAPAEAPAEPSAPSLTSTDPHERRAALEALAAHDLSDADTHRIEALLLDPETDVRLLALHTLARRPDRVQDDAIWQALQDPTDDVRAAAVALAAKRGDVVRIAPLLTARDWPLTQRAVLDRLPEVVANEATGDGEFRRILEAVGDLEPAPLPEELPALRQLALSLGSRRIIESLSWPDVPRLGAIRLLSHDRSPLALRELVAHDGDPIDEIRTIAAVAIAELAEAETTPEPVSATAPQPEEEADRIVALARALLDDDPTVRHLALSGLAGMERAAIVAWVRDAIASGDASWLSLAASTAQMLRLVEGAAVILDTAAELPVDARHTLMDTLRSFVLPPDQLAGLLAHVRPPLQGEAIRMLWRVGGPPVLPHLRSYLDDPSAPVRQAVLEVFTDSSDPSAVDVARIALETDVSAEVRTHAVRMLAHITATPPAASVVRALTDPDPEVRATAIEVLPDVDGTGAVDALTSSLSDRDDRVRLAAAKRLATRSADPELVWSALRRVPDAGRGEIVASFERVRSGSLTLIALERLRSPDVEERTLAVEVCGWGASPGCVEGAIHALLDPVATVRRTATVALGRLRDPAAASALGKALGDPDPEVRIGVVQALGVIDDEAVLGFLVSALNDPDARVRDVTSQVLTEWSSPAVAKRLAGVLAVPRLRDAATDLLTRIGPPAVELLIDVLMQHNPAVVPMVGELLQKIAKPEEFVSRLDAVEPERRLRGIEALGAIGGPAATDALLRSVSDPDERIRGRTAQLLAELDDPRSRDALLGLLRDPIPGVVAAAQDALTRLSG